LGFDSVKMIRASFRAGTLALAKSESVNAYKEIRTRFRKNS